MKHLGIMVRYSFVLYHPNRLISYGVWAELSRVPNKASIIYIFTNGVLSELSNLLAHQTDSSSNTASEVDD